MVWVYEGERHGAHRESGGVGTDHEGGTVGSRLQDHLLEAVDAVVRQRVLGDRRAPWSQAHPAFGRDAEAGNRGMAVAVVPCGQLDATFVLGPNLEGVFEISKREGKSSTICGVENTRRCHRSI